MILKKIRSALRLAMLAIAACGSLSVVPAHAQMTAAEALQKAGVLQRLPNYKGKAGVSPSFVLDPGWPQQLPHNWVIGDVGGITVDKDDNIWIYQRPQSVSSTDSGMQGAVAKNAKGVAVSALGFARPYGQLNGCCMPAPSVLKFNPAGKLLAAWGGPGDPGFLETKCRQQNGCTWPAREHGIYVDHNGFVYLAGNGKAEDFHGQHPWATTFGNDSHILKFKSDGTFVMQIGTPGAKGPNSNDINGGVNGTPQPFWPADMVVDPATNHLFIADGYGNNRVLIVDAATGKYVGHLGAYGQNPVRENTGSNVPGEQIGEGAGSWPADYRAGKLKPAFFRSPVHCAKLSKDGYLYVCDRGNNRVQIFKASEVGKPCANPNGEVGKCGFVGEINVAPQTAAGTSGTVNFSTDPKQTCLYVADLTNDVIYVINRQNLTELNRIGGGGREAGMFHWPHVVAADSTGNLYIGEVDGAARAQKYLQYGAKGCSGVGNPKVGEYRVNGG